MTYLRQDFSVMHELSDEKPWPESQRFDYMLRTRPLYSAAGSQNGIRSSIRLLDRIDRLLG